MINHDQRPPSPYSGGEVPAVSDRVMLLDAVLDGYPASVRSKVTGREGIVKGLTYPNSMPIVFFPALGRKKDFQLGQVQARWLRLIARAEQSE